MEKQNNLYKCDYCDFFHKHHLPVIRHEAKEHQKGDKVQKDDRLEKIVVIFTDYIGRLLGAKGMMKQRDQMKEELKKVLGKEE